MAKKRVSRDEEEPRDLFSSRLFKLGTRLGLALVVIFIFLTLTQCTIERPKAPQWDTQLTVPVVNRTYLMPELIEKINQEGISLDGNDVVFSISHEVDTFSIGAEQLRTDNLAFSVSQQLGNVDLTPPTVDPLAVSYVDIAGLSAGVVAPVSFSQDTVLPPLSDYSSISIVDGAAVLSIGNNLGLDLDTVILELYDYQSGLLIGDTSFDGGLASGASATATFDLDGATLSNELEVRLSCHTPGGTVLSADNKSLTTDIGFAQPLTVSSAQASVPTLSRSVSQNVDLNESEPLYSAILSNGQLSLNIANNTQLDATVQITLPDLAYGGQPLVISQPVAGSSSIQVPVSLAGYELAPQDQSVPQQIAVEVLAATDGSGGSIVTVDQSDSFAVTADLTGLEFASVTGVFDNTAATIDPSTQDIDVPEGFEHVELQQAVLVLEIENHFALTGDISVTVVGNNGKSLSISGLIDAAVSGTPVTTVLYDSAVADFLNPVPSQIDISGSATFGDGSTVATINDGDYVYAQVHVSAPLEVIIAQDTEVEADVESEDIDQEDIDVITDHVTEARFVYTIVNHLPLGVDVSIFLGGDSTTLLSAPQVLIDGLSVGAAPTVAGIVSDTISTGQQTIILDNTDIQVLNNDTLFIGQQIILQGTGGQAVHLTGDDYVQVSGYLEVDYRFDGEF